MKRSHTCGELTPADKGKQITLNGWVHRIRDHGGIHFINLRDRYGITQVVVDETAPQTLKDLAASLKFEYCIAVRGTVRPRPESMVNPDMPTGSIEIEAKEIEVLSACETLPFMVDERSEAREELRLKYRFLDLRSFAMQQNIRLRHEVSFAAREYLVSKGFYEIETPTLIRSTPEGARDFLVPSRIKAGSFYALPQSPQLFKQILMVSGFDRYFQLAHCYRDEDARGDRQPEHTQIDMEMSFVSKEDVFEVVEGMLSHVFKKTLNIEIPTPFQRIPFDTAMDLYGSDKPDLRFGLAFRDISQLAEKSDFNVFKSVVGDGGVIKALKVSKGAAFSRKQIDELEKAAKTYGAKGLAWMKVTDSGLDGGIARFFENITDTLISTMEAEPGDLLLFVADKWKTACTSLGAVRSKLGEDLELGRSNEYRFCWVIDFPLFEEDEETGGWAAAHHMFTMPQQQYLDTMEKDPGAVKGDLYDLVCNGMEIASGSIRIHDPEIQKRIFNIVGFDEEEARRRFGFLLDAFQYGPPPHGGIAPGLDRLVMIMAGEKTIRDVIPFPKNTIGASPMDDSPSLVDEDQLKELHLQVIEESDESEGQDSQQQE
ncbi:MAG: aspartate--tRNA ligase [Spirochaetales bacterium]|nr:aspartate--tRNA ligase [Spirochaetales bacterium]MCF7938767.1 aspartate--tRNA ligase [Spirochaetales bacterium]